MPVIIKKHELKIQITLNSSVDQVASFFSITENILKISPSWLKLCLHEPVPERLEKGANLTSTFRLNGIPVKWKLEVSEFEGYSGFTVLQKSGPFFYWSHRHKFEKSENKTIFYDHVNYSIPGGILEPYINHFYVLKKLKAIFDFRQKKIIEIFNQL